MTSATHKIKCRFCSYETAAFTTNKGGKARSGVMKLRNHIERAHADEADQIFHEMDDDSDDI